MASEAAPAAPAFDKQAVREKYRRERDKRVRTDGNEQYLEVSGRFAHYLADPYAAPLERQPVRADVGVLIIGGGFGGLLIAARLREAGITDLRIVESGGDFGGTWYWNRYPGAACDTESYIYLPLLEETGYMPTEKYAKAPEILAHSQRIGRHYGLYANALFQTQVTELRWDDKAARWSVSTDRGDRLRARFVCMANGPLSRPKLPAIPGLESFRGHSFLTCRWDYAYTGGDGRGRLERLADKRVGVIGTGASGVQVVPPLGASARQLCVFQRTPSSVDVRANRPTDPAWARSLEPGWQRRRMENFSTLTTGGFAEEDLVMDGWTEIFGTLLGLRRASQGGPGEGRSLEVVDFEKMEQIRARAASTVRDPNTAEALKPYYRQFCKRPCFHDEYLEAFNRPNVTLVDTDGRGPERFTEHGLVANGTEYPLDCVIFATGFEVGTSFERRAGYEVYGRGGVALSEKWRDGISTLYGMQTHGFPNCFIVSLAQVGIASNVPHLLDVQSRHIAYVLEHAHARGARSVDATARAEEAWVDQVIATSATSMHFLETCTPGYYNNEGQPDARLQRNGYYSPGVVAFASILDAWREEGSLAGIAFEGQAQQAPRRA